MTSCFSITSFAYFDCREYEDSEQYLVASPAVKCTDEKYLANRPVVQLLAFTVTFGFPYAYHVSAGIGDVKTAKAEHVRLQILLSRHKASLNPVRASITCGWQGLFVL